MSPERWRRIESLYYAALERDPATRAGFVSESSDGDEELRREVESLLAQDGVSLPELEISPLLQCGNEMLMIAQRDGIDLLAALSESRPVFRKGDLVGRYEIVDALGTGGMGEVYLARDPELERKVAIKVVAEASAADREKANRLLAEGQAVSALNHPNILTVYDIGEIGGRPYLATEFVEGITLREHLTAGPVSPSEAVRIGIQVASALAASHAAGILHRDIKPENLMVRRDGLVKVLDFGLAKVSRQAAAGAAGNVLSIRTEHGKIAGSLPYMSPEQIRGDDLDPRTDIWSLGVVLYEMLSGERPFVSRNEAVSGDNLINRIQHERPMFLKTRVPDSSARLARVVQRCLSKQAEDRFENADDLKSALEQSIHQIRPIAAVLSTAIVLIVIIAFVMAKSVAPSPDPPAFRYFTYSGHDSSPAVSPDGRTIAFTSDRDGQPRIWLKHVTGSPETPISTGPDDAPRFSADGKSILFIRREGSHTSLFSAPVAGGKARHLLDDVVGADSSPDGAEIAVIQWKTSPGFTGSIVRVIKSSGSGPIQELARIPLRQLQMPRWSPGGNDIAMVDSIAGFGTEVVVITRAGRVMVLDARTERAISSPAWLSSGQDVAYVRGDYAASSVSDFVRHSVHTDRLTPLLSVWPHRSRCLDIIGDGRVVFDTSSRRSNLREISLQDGSERWLTRGTSMDRQPAVSPDGKRVLFTSDRSGNTDIWQLDMRTNQFAPVIDHPSDDMDPAYAPDGDRIIWTSNRDGHLEIYMADKTGTHTRRVTDDRVDAQNATMTADGKWIVYTSSHPEKKGIWKIHPDGSGAQRIVSGTCFNPEVSPDGKYALYITSLHPAENVIRVVRVEDGVHERFQIVCEILKPTQVIIGRARWSLNRRAILFVGQDGNGVHGIFEQPFMPDKNTDQLRRRVAAFDPDTTTESFGISRDGRLIVANWDQLWSLVIGDSIPGAYVRRDKPVRASRRQP